MPDTGGLPPEMARGWIATIVGVFGSGVAWVIKGRAAAKRRQDERRDAWQRELTDWQKRLDTGRAEYIAQLERRVADVEKKDRERDAKDDARDAQLRALRLAFELVSSALRKIDGSHVALSMAEELLKSAFPPSVDLPGPLRDAVQKLDQIG